jgi:hypothetical protein
MLATCPWIRREPNCSPRDPTQYGHLLDVLDDDEDLCAAAPVAMNLRLAVIGLTPRRLVIVKAGVTMFSRPNLG